MPSAEQRRLAHRSTPSPAPGGSPMDDLSVAGMDSDADLTDQLIFEAGSLEEDAILETGLPDDYDPSGGSAFQGGGQAGRVFRMDGVESDAASAAGSTRVGLLPKMGKQQVPVVPKLAPPAPPPPPVEPDEPDEDEEEGPAEEIPGDLLPEEEDGPGLAAAPAADEEPLDDDLMAELSEGVREVATHAAPAAPAAPLPAPAAPPPAARPAPEPEERAAAPRLPFLSAFEDPLLALPKLLPGIAILSPGAAPGACNWVCPLDAAADEAFFPVLGDLAADLRLSRGTLLPIRGGTPRAAALRPVIAAARPGLRVSGTHHLQHRDAGEAVFFHVSTNLYSHGETHGLLLVEAVKRGDRVSVRRLCLFAPSLLLG